MHDVQGEDEEDKMKIKMNGKAAGPSGLVSEVVKSAVEAGINVIVVLINQIIA